MACPCDLVTSGLLLPPLARRCLVGPVQDACASLPEFARRCRPSWGVVCQGSRRIFLAASRSTVRGIGARGARVSAGSLLINGATSGSRSIGRVSPVWLSVGIVGTMLNLLAYQSAQPLIVAAVLYGAGF